MIKRTLAAGAFLTILAAFAAGAFAAAFLTGAFLTAATLAAG